MDVGDYGSQDWFLCSQCKRAFHSKIQLYQHKRLHDVEYYNLHYNTSHEDLKRKRVEEWVMQVQLQLQLQSSNKYSSERELEKENSDLKYDSERLEIPGPSQDSSSLEGEECPNSPSSHKSLKQEKASKKSRSTLAPVSNRVVLGKRRKAKKGKKPRKTLTVPKIMKVKKEEKQSDDKKMNKEEMDRLIAQNVQVVVRLEEYEFCKDCGSTFWTSKDFSGHFPCKDSKPRSVQLPRQRVKRKAPTETKSRTRRRRRRN